MNKFVATIDKENEEKLSEVCTIITKCNLMEPTTYAIMTDYSKEELEEMSFIKKVQH